MYNYRNQLRSIAKNQFPWLLNLYRIYRYHQGHFIGIQIETTTQCNLNCKMCPRDKNRIGNMDYDKFTGFINSLKKSTVIELCGVGETMMTPNLLDCLLFLKRSPHFFGFTSNFTIFNKELYDRILSKGKDSCRPDRICVSIDAADKKNYEEIRRGADFDEVLDNIRYLINRGYDNLSISSTIFPENEDQMPAIVKLASEVGIKKIRFQLAGIIGRIPKKVNKALCLQARDLGKKLGVEVTSPNILEFQGCVNPSWIYITYDGEVLPCCWITTFHTPKEYYTSSFGNIFKDNLDDIWNSPKWKVFRWRTLKREYPEFCHGCLMLDEDAKFYNI